MIDVRAAGATWMQGIPLVSEYPTTGTYSAWSNLGNLDDTTPAAYASTTIAAVDQSRVIELQIPSGLLTDDVQILGIEVEVMCHQTVGTDVFINKVQLRNDAAGAEDYLSANRSTRDFLNVTPGTQYRYGSQLDTWELDKIDQDDIKAGNYSLLVQFENTNGTTARTVNVDHVQINIHYAVKGQQVYLYNGTSDVSTAFIYAYQVFDGEWSTDDAEGWMTLHNVSAPSRVTPGLEIRTGTVGTGDLIGLTRTLSKNLLPSLEEMDGRGTIYQSRVATFWAWYHLSV
jgi:hypothetical protein